MNMQQLMIQAQKMQREMKKAMDQLHQQEFKNSKAGAVSVTMKGDKSIISIEIDKDAFNPEDKEMVEEMIASCINELNEKINAAEEEINNKVSGGMGGLGF